MFILREKGRMIFPRNILLRSAAYNTVSTLTILSLHKINTIERYMKCWRVLRITKTPGEYEICKHNPEFLSGIYMTAVTEA